MEKNEHTDHVFRELLEERYGKFNYCVDSDLSLNLHLGNNYV